MLENWNFNMVQISLSWAEKKYQPLEILAQPRIGWNNDPMSIILKLFLSNNQDSRLGHYAVIKYDSCH